MAFSVNTVAVVGRLVRDVELKYTAAGDAVTTVRIAVDGASRDKDEEGHYKAGFFDVTVWGQSAENLAQYQGKGDQIGVVGRLQFREWDGKDGTKRNAVEISSTTIQYLGSPKDREDANGQTSFTPAAAAAGRTAPPADDFTSADDDIPF